MSWSTGAATFVIAKNGTQVGTIVFSAGNASGVVTVDSAVLFAVGDKLTVTAPASVDATLADVDFTLVASAK